MVKAGKGRKMPATRTVAGDGWSDEEWLLGAEMNGDGRNVPEVRHRRRSTSGGSEDGNADGLPKPPWTGNGNLNF